MGGARGRDPREDTFGSRPCRGAGPQRGGGIQLQLEVAAAAQTHMTIGEEAAAAAALRAPFVHNGAVIACWWQRVGNLGDVN